MTKRILILCFVFIALANFSVKAEEYDFRKTRWGMTVEEVQINELSKIVKIENDDLIYFVEMLGQKCFLEYKFKKNKLISGIYLFDNVSKKERNIIYDSIVTSLKDKYQEEYGENPFKKNIRIFKNKNTYITIINTDNLGVLYEEKIYYEKRKLLLKNKREKKSNDYQKDLDSL